MTTKQYLGQLDKIDDKIADKIQEAQKWYEIAMSNSSKELKPDKIQTSMSPDRMGDAVAYALDCQREADKIAYDMAKLRKTIITQIDNIGDNGHYEILKSYYIKNKNISTIADEKHYSRKQIKRKYERAIKRFEELYGETYLKDQKEVRKCPQMSTSV